MDKGIDMYINNGCNFVLYCNNIIVLDFYERNFGFYMVLEWCYWVCSCCLRVFWIRGDVVFNFVFD